MTHTGRDTLRKGQTGSGDSEQTFRVEDIQRKDIQRKGHTEEGTCRGRTYRARNIQWKVI